MLTAETLKAIQIEISSNCNAGCLECARWVNEESKQQLNPKLNFGHKGNFPIELFRNIFQADKLKSLRGLFFDGNYVLILQNCYKYVLHESFCMESIER